MLSFFIGVLTLLLVLNCLVLILLVLVQLPKKDAGAGIAFGGGAADALFGAGSGNALTKITKWAAGAFLALALVLAWMQTKAHTDNSGANFAKLLEQQQQKSPALTAPQPPKPQTPASGLLTTPTPATTPATNAEAPVTGTNSAK
ncbi:MAG TPA: preprotein translocase subunit SecG [Verrucomicrobiae bacterium]